MEGLTGAFSNLIGAITTSQISLGAQMNAQSRTATNLADLQGDLAEAWMGNANTSAVVKNSTTFNGKLYWSSDLPVPNAKDAGGRTVYFTTQEVLGVLNWIAASESDITDGDTLKKYEAARATWSNLMNAMGNYSDIQKAPINTTSQGMTTELSTTQNMVSSSGGLGSGVADIVGTTPSLLNFG